MAVRPKVIAEAGPVSAPGCLIHIGMPKTATTMLQHMVFAEHSEVCYLGKHSGAPNFSHEALKPWSASGSADGAQPSTGSQPI